MHLQLRRDLTRFVRTARHASRQRQRSAIRICPARVASVGARGASDQRFGVGDGVCESFNIAHVITRRSGSPCMRLDRRMVTRPKMPDESRAEAPKPTRRITKDRRSQRLHEPHELSHIDAQTNRIQVKSGAKILNGLIPDYLRSISPKHILPRRFNPSIHRVLYIHLSRVSVCERVAYSESRARGIWCEVVQCPRNQKGATSMNKNLLARLVPSRGEGQK